MKKILLLGVVSASLLSAGTPLGNELKVVEGGINLNNEDLGFRVAGYTTPEGTQSSLKFALDGVNAEGYKRLTFSTLIQNKIEPIPGAYMGVGLSYAYLESDEGQTLNLHQLPLTIEGTYYFPELNYNIPPTAIKANIQYAPKVLSFGDSEGYQHYSVEGSIEPIENIELYIGYRFGNVDSVFGVSDEFASDAYFGLNFTF